MSLSDLLQTYGYWVLAAGCLLEGETILVMAGFAAYNGVLDPVAVLCIAAVCGFLGDMFFFWLGRRHGAAVLLRWPSIAKQAGRMHRLIERFHAPVIILVRFAYGLRIAGPILIGMTQLSTRRFAFYNAIGAVLWACIVAGVGWVFGNAAEAALANLESVQMWLLLGVVLIGVAVWLVQRRRKRTPPPGV